MAIKCLSFWTDWKEIRSFMPHRSIEGNFIWGDILIREHSIALIEGSDPTWYQYTTKKELFIRALAGR